MSWFLFPATAARREPPLAAESRPARPAAAQKPNGECLEDTPDETTHTVAKVVAQKKSVTLRFTLQFPPMSMSMKLLAAVSIGIKDVGHQASSPSHCLVFSIFVNKV